MATPYRMAFACLSCCKSFKRKVDLYKEYKMDLNCPDCGGLAHNFGRHFKAPKKSDKKQWQKIAFLLEHGFRFQKIRFSGGHHNTVSYPNTLEEAKEFVVKYRKYAVRPHKKI